MQTYNRIGFEKQIFIKLIIEAKNIIIIGSGNIKNKIFEKLSNSFYYNSDNIEFNTIDKIFRKHLLNR